MDNWEAVSEIVRSFVICDSYLQLHGVDPVDPAPSSSSGSIKQLLLPRTLTSALSAGSHSGPNRGLVNKCFGHRGQLKQIRRGSTVEAKRVYGAVD
jgi:hypothetical protein